MRTFLLLAMGPVVFAMGYGAVPLAVFLAAFGVGRELFPDPDQRWTAFALALGALAVWFLIIWRLFRLYDRWVAAVRGDIAGAGPARGLELWACTRCGAPVTIYDVACRACGALITADVAARRPAQRR